MRKLTETERRQTPETLATWKQDAIRAKKQHRELMKNPHRNLPDTAPARMAYDSRRKSIDKKEYKGISKALKNAMKD